MASDRWGHTDVEVDGQVVLRYWYSENDGWAFLRKGPERTLCVDVLDATAAPAAFESAGFHPETRGELGEQLARGNMVHLTVFLGSGHKDDPPARGVVF